MANRQSEAVLNPSPGLSGAPGALGYSDRQLLMRFAAHRDEPAEAAFTMLVRRHGPLVLRVCEQILGDRHAAEDAFQVTFLVLARRAGSIRQPELLGHWLHGVALRTAREVKMQRLRTKKRESAKAEETTAEPIVAECAELQAVCREELEILHEEVARLPERYRGPVVLCELEGMSYHEAATRLRCPVGTIGVRLKRARQRLRERLIRAASCPPPGSWPLCFAPTKHQRACPRCWSNRQSKPQWASRWATPWRSVSRRRPCSRLRKQSSGRWLWPG